MIVVDTNVISELMRPVPAPQVWRWVHMQPNATTFTTSVCEAELLLGVALMADGRRKLGMQAVVAAIMASIFADRVLPFDRPAAAAYAEIASARRRIGRPVLDSDLQIAAIARARGASLIATRNLRDFAGCGVAMVDPWGS